MSHRCATISGIVGLWAAVAACPALGAYVVRDHYSPLNNERPRRNETRYIILHTTEAPFASSLREVTRRGTCHYLINTNGRVYRIIHRSRVARHSGRSMWNGRTGLDDVSIGIEVVGYHNRELTAAQYTSLRPLLAELKARYRIPDERILPHSMVAYGAPNRWHSRSHRGRKRCAMQFARANVRSRLGIDGRPSFDPDVRARRLIAADAYLASALWGEAQPALGPARAEAPSRGIAASIIEAGRTPWDIARGMAKSAETVYVFPDGTRLRGNEIVRWRSIPPGTRVILDSPVAAEPEAPKEEEDRLREVLADGVSASSIAGEEAASESTFYFMPDGAVIQGPNMRAEVLTALPKGTRVLVGYANGGEVQPRRSAFDICGDRWKLPSTYFRFPNGRIVRGSDIRENTIPRGSQVFYVP